MNISHVQLSCAFVSGVCLALMLSINAPLWVILLNAFAMFMNGFLGANNLSNEHTNT